MDALFAALSRRGSKDASTAEVSGNAMSLIRLARNTSAVAHILSLWTQAVVCSAHRMRETLFPPVDALRQGIAEPLDGAFNSAAQAVRIGAGASRRRWWTRVRPA